MKLKKLMLATAIFTSLTGIYGCSEGDDSKVIINDGTGTTGTAAPVDTGTVSVSMNCPDWASAKNQDNDGNDVCALPSNILEDRTLSSDVVWFMDGRVTVGNGNSQMSVLEGTLENGNAVINATLTIEAGTQVKAAKGTFANLLITRGSKIEATGTATDPIVFSSDDEGEDGSGEWGGLILHGYGLHNNANDTTCAGGTCQNVDAEGESGFAGGSTGDDSSGTLMYVVVTEGGYEFAPGNEINGVSLVAVGSGTTIDFLQVNSNSNDGVEFYGGSVNAKHLVLTGNLDDSVDWDEGFQGNLQYVLVKQSNATDGNAIEADTEGSLDFLSKPFIANATFIGDGAKDTLLVFKKTSGGFLSHSVLTSVAVSDGGTGTITTCVDSSASAYDLMALVFDTASVIADCPTSGDINLVPAAIDVALDSNYASQAPEASVAALDIATFNGANAESVADPAFFDATTYAGAVNPDGSDLWYQGWIVEGSL